MTLFPVLYGLWDLYLVRCELSRCKELAEQMFALAQGSGVRGQGSGVRSQESGPAAPQTSDALDPDLLMVAHNVMQQPLFHQGDFAGAGRHQGRALALYDRQRHRTLTVAYGEDPGVGCLIYGAVTLWHLGHPEQARRSAEAARGLADELVHPFNTA